MKEIGNINLFEDEAFLSRMNKLSAAVFVSGAVLALAFWLEGLFHIRFDLFFVLYLVLGVVGSLVLHEATHAFFFKLFAPKGSHVFFGANLEKGMIYACADGIGYTRRQYLTVSLSPTFVVSIACVVAALLTGRLATFYLVGIVHLTGCAGDWLYSKAILSDPHISYIEDTDFGARFYGTGK